MCSFGWRAVARAPFAFGELDPWLQPPGNVEIEEVTTVCQCDVSPSLMLHGCVRSIALAESRTRATTITTPYLANFNGAGAN